MPIPFVLLAGAAAAGAVGVTNGASGAQKIKKSSDEQKIIGMQHDNNIEFYESRFKSATENMDQLGEYEFIILSDFQNFSDVIEKIENRPKFGEINHDGFQLPDFSLQDIKDASIGAVAALGGIGGVTTGTFGGFAAAGATTAAVAALGTASTGTAISTLSGAAATNATLAALGGGSLAAGGGGMALGATVLGATTLGVGLMVGGIIFNITGNQLIAKLEESKELVEKETEEVNKICFYLERLNSTAVNYTNALSIVKKIYDKHFARLEYTVLVEGKTDYFAFSDTDKLAYQNTVLLVGILYDMLKVKLVKKVDENYNEVNIEEVSKSANQAVRFLENDKLVKPEELLVVSQDMSTPIKLDDIRAKLDEVEEKEKSGLQSMTEAAGKNITDATNKMVDGIKKNFVCEKCGSSIKLGDKFCTKCGTPVKK